jgi:hypothetical protein
MFKFALITLFALGCNAAYNNGQLGVGLSSSGYGSALQAAPALSSYAAPAQNYAQDIQTRRTYEVRPVALQNDYAQPQIIEVQPEQLPVQVHFRTASSRVNVQQSHQPSHPSQVEHASFQDEPHRVVHEVVKPVIQEVREIIQPYRRVTQEIRPVIEEVHTVVHKGEGRRSQAQLPVRAAQNYGNAGSAGYKGAKARARA